MTNFAQRVLILFAHPALQKSRVNRVLAAAVRDLPGVTFHDLYEVYPDFNVDVHHEQQLLEKHDLIVLQHPFFWYSTPALVKEWQDLVLEHAWAYGHLGRALHGKALLSVITTGGTEEAYQRHGFNRYTMRELLVPIEQTAHLCGMKYLPPFVVHGTHSCSADTVKKHANDYRRLLISLRDGHPALDRVQQLSRINQDLDALLGADEEDA